MAAPIFTRVIGNQTITQLTRSASIDTSPLFPDGDYIVFNWTGRLAAALYHAR